ncbi:AMIN-like domain-containing (lipo)protein [Streptomyces pathocidini]|uniref:AMIN-like domain-containing (lipo)protein n=1 Tax=Streptomyces pathocidini TaxID=1650571 RepID=UPI0006E3281C|nr:hypothetical protein [Streptomyces pathocidini]
MRGLRKATAVVALAAVGIMGTAGVAGAATQSAAKATACSTAWGSTLKSATGTDTEPLRNVRTGRHTCFDRIVFDISGVTGKVGYHVGYVNRFYQDGSGKYIPVKGGAILQIIVNAPSYDPATIEQTYPGKGAQPLPGVNVSGYKTFRDAKFGASYEGQSQIGLGVRARLPFQVFQNGDRLIVDVAHTWTG